MQPPWRLVEQRVDTDKQPHKVFLEIAADRGAEYPCPECGRLCKAHYFHEFSPGVTSIFSSVIAT
ncbi:hypothetical protein DFAR_3720006 [Desulfarculales bacterium]